MQASVCSAKHCTLTSHCPRCSKQCTFKLCRLWVKKDKQFARHVKSHKFKESPNQH